MVDDGRGFQGSDVAAGARGDCSILLLARGRGLERFAGFVEVKKEYEILVDVDHFRHKMGPEVQEWRVKNISTRYSAAGVKRFAFLFPPGAQIPPMMNQSSREEAFQTRAFDNIEQATQWLTRT